MSAGLLEHLSDNPIIAILRGRSASNLAATIETLIEAGIQTLEVTLPTPGALDAIHDAVSRYGSNVWVGAGTVTTTGDVARAAQAGSRFIVSPNTDAEVLLAAGRLAMESLPGAGTATEILAAHRMGATAVKVFPVRSMGPDFIRDIHGPLPHIPLIAVGGVGLTDIRPYLRAGAVALGIGSPLIGDALDGGSQSEFLIRARAFVAAGKGL